MIVPLNIAGPDPGNHLLEVTAKGVGGELRDEPVGGAGEMFAVQHEL